jgi:hypothetical protein
MLTSVASIVMRGVSRVLVITCAVSCVAQTISFNGPRLSSPDPAVKFGRLISGDWNGDGRIDIATVGAEQNLLIFEGDGIGGFNRVSELALASTPVRIAAADFNGDGKSDLLAFFGQSEFVTFLNEGDFRFAAPNYFHPQIADVPPGGPAILEFALSDFNRDGKSDLLLILNSVGRQSVMLSNGDGTFSGPLIGPRTFNFVAVDDSIRMAGLIF